MAFPFLAAAAGLGSLMGIGSGKRKQNRINEQWEKNNQYNHPSSQMARLREADLNPNLIYGDSVSGASGASSSPPATAEPYKPDVGRAIGDYVNIKSTRLQNDNVRASNTNLIKDGRLKDIQAIKLSIESGLKGTELEIARQTMKSVINQIKDEGDITQIKRFTAKQEYDINEIYPSQMKELQGLSHKATISKLKQFGQNLTNSQKLEQLRGLEIQIKESNIKYFEKNEILRAIGQLIPLFK